MKAMMAKYLPMTETSCYILLATESMPMHGYAIVQHVRRITNNRITLGNGTLYGTISKMEKDGLLQMILDDEKKKIYEITSLGKDILRSEKKRIEELHNNLKGVADDD
ncbi:MAG: PadR family transcriptional regulator [Turicibacter sp.]|nr:PadR family transcriptional regulator [Turicibacter sp.]